MKIIRPFVVTDASLVSSSVPESDYADWAVGTTYALGDIRQVTTVSYSVSLSIAIPCLITLAAHGFENGQIVIFSTTGALPTGITAGIPYYIVQRTINNFKISTTKNGVAISTSGTQSGTHTASFGLHRVYESLQGTNIGNKPWDAINAAFWLNTAPTNRYAMLDVGVSTQTAAQDKIKTVIQTTGRINAVALVNILGGGTIDISTRDPAPAYTSAVTITNASPSVITWSAHGMVNGDMVRLSTTGALPAGFEIDTTYYIVNKTINTFQLSISSGGAAINTSSAGSGTQTAQWILYSRIYSLSTQLNVSNWYSYFFEPYQNRSEFVDLGLPLYGGMELTAILKNIGTYVHIGGLVTGITKDIGGTQIGASVGITDYSVKSADEFGNSTITERAYSKRGTFTVKFYANETDSVQLYLAGIRATPSIFIGSDIYDSTIIYGFYKDFSVVIAEPNVSICNIEVEGLI